MLPEMVALNNGVQMPRIGFGTWQVPPNRAREAVLWALRAGYRLIDTSLNYHNEREVGQAIRDFGLERKELFVTTKLEVEDHGLDQTPKGFRRSLANLYIGYVDLYLIHWPGSRLRVETWKAMEDLLEEGNCRAIGVSNYTVRHLREVLEHGRVVPAVNQVELHPFNRPGELIQFCRAHGIQMESYSPLTQGSRLTHPTILNVARRVGRTPAQVVLRWHLQHDFVPIPRSISRHHIQENIQVFDFSLADTDMAELDSLDRSLHFSWDPTDVP